MLMQSIINWFKIAKPKPTNQDLIKQIAFHFEEFAEMCEALNLLHLRDNVLWERNYFLDGSRDPEFVKKFERFLNKERKIALLDAMCDQVVTSIGVMEFMGAKTLRALDEVNQSNYTKFSVNEQGEFVPYIKPDGKIGKNPDTYREPQLADCLGVNK